ncbi:MAG: hypothetical protein V3S41_09975 [Spirochaetia bacterium]
MLTVLTGGDDVGPIPNLLDALQENCERGVSELRLLPGLGSWWSVPGPVAPFGRAAASNAKIQETAAQMRKRRAIRINRRRTLELIVRGGGGDKSAPLPRSPGHRDFVAGMMGDVAIAGPTSGLLSGGLPAAFQKELDNGPGAMDPRPTPPAPRELPEQER